MNDEIELAGSQAWHDGKGEADCPYTDTYGAGDYWGCQAGLRQRWLYGFRRAWQQNEIMMRNRRWQKAEWMWHAD